MTTLVALTAGFVLDLLLGDPPRIPHVVVLMGRVVAGLEKALRRVFPRTPAGEVAGGALLAAVVAALAFAAPWLVLAFVRDRHPAAGVALESLMCYQALAGKSLRDAAGLVHGALRRGDLAGARAAVARIVGRDTDRLDEPAVVRATVETVAENASDGVIAPMLYFAVGGAPLALLYKAVNTMDSMLGYKNEKYLYFGRAAARLDDAANFVPARFTALLLAGAAALCGLDWRSALRVGRRDGHAHTSPNAGHPEAACAGALGITLGGDSTYGGQLVRKPTLGDARREPEPDDIMRAGRLLYACAALGYAACCAGLLLYWKGTTAWN